MRKSAQRVTREELLAFYDGKVVRWSKPDDVVFVDSLPHTATGKVLKTQLREEYTAYQLRESAHTHARNVDDDMSVSNDE